MPPKPHSRPGAPKSAPTPDMHDEAPDTPREDAHAHADAHDHELRDIARVALRRQVTVLEAISGDATVDAHERLRAIELLGRMAGVDLGGRGPKHHGPKHDGPKHGPKHDGPRHGPKHDPRH